jgi:hypothetical protein
MGQELSPFKKLIKSKNYSEALDLLSKAPPITDQDDWTKPLDIFCTRYLSSITQGKELTPLREEFPKIINIFERSPFLKKQESCLLFLKEVTVLAYTTYLGKYPAEGSNFVKEFLTPYLSIAPEKLYHLVIERHIAGLNSQFLNKLKSDPQSYGQDAQVKKFFSIYMHSIPMTKDLFQSYEKVITTLGLSSDYCQLLLEGIKHIEKGESVQEKELMLLMDKSLCPHTSVLDEKVARGLVYGDEALIQFLYALNKYYPPKVSQALEKKLLEKNEYYLFQGYTGFTDKELGKKLFLKHREFFPYIKDVMMKECKQLLYRRTDFSEHFSFAVCKWSK